MKFKKYLNDGRHFIYQDETLRNLHNVAKKGGAMTPQCLPKVHPNKGEMIVYFHDAGEYGFLNNGPFNQNT